MIIQTKPIADAYITNISTQYNDGLYANTGNAATIDLFKLYNENKNSKSWIPLTINNPIQDNEKFSLIDSYNNSVTFVFKLDSETRDGSTDNNGHVIIGLLNNNDGNQASVISTVINNINDFNNGLTLDITAYNNSSNIVLLKQNKPGERGDTKLTLPDSGCITHFYNEQIENFSRIDYSVGLIKFDFKSLKEKWKINNNLLGSFENLKANLILKDITTGISKPKNYKIEALKLNKKFDEGNGLDTIYFSDLDIVNFTSLTQEESWEIPGFISSSEVDKIENSEDFLVSEGSENISIDITSYIKNALINNPDDDCGIAIKITDEFLYDKKTYFVKRLGTKNLINKSLIPLLEIKINDSIYNFTTHSFLKNRSFNTVESFFIFNKKRSSLIDFPVPGINYNLNLRVKSKKTGEVYLNDINSNENIINYLGEEILGIKKAEFSLNMFDESISADIEDDQLKTEIEWYWIDKVTKNVSSQDLVAGKRYKISIIADSDFTLSGASDNIVGTEFVATGPTPGVGIAIEFDEKSLLKKDVTFESIESLESKDLKNLISIVKASSNNSNILYADDSVCALDIYFIDSQKDYKPSKKPYDILSEDLGEVYYQIFDIDSKETIVDFDELSNSTLLFYDGTKYKANVFIPSHLKGKNIGFNFKYKNSFTKNDVLIRSSSNIKLEK